MTFTLELHELKKLCADMAALGVATYQKEQAPANDLISQREAYRLFKEVRVKRWLEKGLVRTRRTGSSANSKRFYSRAELLAVSNAERINPMLD